MNSFFVKILICLFCFHSIFSQSNEVLINQALQTAKSKNIRTQDQAVKALEGLGLTENQARQLARQRGISYDDLLNQNFIENEKLLKDNSKDPDNSILETLTDTIKDNQNNNFENKNNFISLINQPKYFGYEIFKNNPYLEKEYLLGNIDEGYLISPGDEIRIIVYGDNSFEQSVTVDRNGNINVSGYGLFFAAGNTFKTLKSRLKIFLGKYLSGLVSVPQKAFMDVSLLQLKPTKVIVLGNVESPGPQILTSSGSVLGALYSAGGIKNNGTLREIRVFRNNKLLKEIDLYDYITTGELRDDIRLTNNDVVFVPNRKNYIEMRGEVKTPAIYEISDNENLFDLIKYSGGLLPTTQTSKVNIQRIIPSEKRSENNISDRELITVNYKNSLIKNEEIKIMDGDQIIFYRILDLQTNQVTISGHVYEPGTYSLETYKTLKSLIFNAGKGLMPDAYFSKIDVYSINNEGFEILNSYNLIDIFEGSLDVDLLDGDRVVVYSSFQVEGDKMMTISGFGIPETTLEWKENYSLYDFIFSFNEINNPNFKTNFLETRIDLKRLNVESGDYKTIKFNFGKTKELKNTFILPGDRVLLFGKDVVENINKTVGIYGFVKNSSIYTLEENMYPEDLILIAGGFNIEADQGEIIVNRVEINPEEERVVRKYNYSVDKKYLVGESDAPTNKFILEENDIIVVRKEIGYQKPINIKIGGEVKYEQNYILEFKKSSFADVIEYAGGLTKDANLRASTLTRDGNIMSVDLSKIRGNQQFLLDGDEIFIASNNGNVRTLGAVENESNFIWKRGLKSKNYIKKSGGKIRKESGKSYILYPNGQTKSIGFFKNPTVLPNSTIVINRKIKKERTEGKFLNDFSSTFGIIASALTTILLASKL